MSYRQVEQTTETVAAEHKQGSPEKENDTQRQTAVSPLAVTGGGPDTQANDVRQQTNGRLSLAGNTLLQLQNQFGNRHVQQLINPQQRLIVQPKLMLGDVNTPSEREADQISGEIIGNRQATSAPTPVNGTTMPIAPETESLINQARGSGQPLPESTQTHMSQSLGTDLSGVRVHTDTRADSLNQALQSKAFTTGQDIFFRQGAYTPETSGGQQLLAHELTHVIQQIGPSSSPVIQRNPNDKDKTEKPDTTEIGFILAGGLSRIGVGVAFAIPYGAAMLAAPVPTTIIGFVKNVFGAIRGVCQTIRAGIMLFLKKAAAKIRTVSEKIISALSKIEEALSWVTGMLDVASFSNIARMVAGGFALAENAVRELENRGMISESPRLREALHTISEMATVFADVTSEGLVHALLDFAKEYGEKILTKLKRFAEPYLPQSFSQQPQVEEQPEEDTSWIDDALDEMSEEEEDQTWIDSALNEIPEKEEDLSWIYNLIDQIPEDELFSWPQQPEVKGQPSGQINWEAKQEAKVAQNDLFTLMDSLTIEEVKGNIPLAPTYLGQPGLVRPDQIIVPPPRSDQHLSSNEIPQQQEIKVPSPPKKAVSTPAPPSKNAPKEVGRSRKWLRVVKKRTLLSSRPGGQQIHTIMNGEFVYLTGKNPQSKKNEMWVEVRYYLKSGSYSTKGGESVTGWVPVKSLRRLNDEVI